MKVVLFCGGLSMRMRPEIFDYMHDGEELVEEPFGRLINERKLMACPGRCGISNTDKGRRT
jgi:hypothetical protein